MDWNFSGSSPVYVQIMRKFREAVLAGTYNPGERIPSVRELASESRVNPNTMQRALSELEREGLLISHGTQGRCVTEDETVLQQLRSTAVEEAVESCVLRFRALGLTMEQAATLLLNFKKEE